MVWTESLHSWLLAEEVDQQPEMQPFGPYNKIILLRDMLC